MESVEVCVQSLDVQIHLASSQHRDDVSREWGKRVGGEGEAGRKAL